MKEMHSRHIYQGSLGKGVDIVERLSGIIQQNGITAGMVTGIGALSEAELGYFNAQTKSYEKKRFQENLEIVSLKGNISRKDGDIVPHLHAVLAKKDFSALGGHLFSGIVYAFEFEIIPFEGGSLTRTYDDATGLFLWKE